MVRTFVGAIIVVSCIYYLYDLAYEIPYHEEESVMKYLILIVISLLVLSGCGGDGQETAVVQEIPTLPVDTLSLMNEIGVELGDSTNTFGSIVSALIYQKDRILVLDQVANCVKIYDSNGNYLQQLSRQGNGPGELVMPWDMFIMPDGRLMILDMGKRGFVVFDDSLRFIEEFGLWTQNPPMQGTAVSDSQFVAYKTDTDMHDNNLVMHRRIALYTCGEEEWDYIFWQDSIEASMNEIIENPSMFILSILDPLSIGGNGSDGIYFSLKDGEEYRVTGWNPAGEEILSICLDIEPVNKTTDEIAAESTYVNNYISRISSGGDAGLVFEPDPFKDMVIGVDIGPDGNLWVRRGTTDMPFFDIFDTESGVLLHHTVFPVDGWSWKTSVSPDGILAWEEDPEEGYQKLYILGMESDKPEDYQTLP